MRRIPRNISDERPVREDVPTSVPGQGHGSRQGQGARMTIPVTVSPAPAPSQEEGVYVISVAARLLSMHPQTLRKYERAGLVTPSRTIGLLRLYSDQDINRLRMVKHLVDHWGMNVAGVEVAMDLLDRMLGMQQRLLTLMRADDDRAGDDVTVVVRETWEEVVRALGLPETTDDTAHNAATPTEVESVHDTSQRQGTRGSGTHGAARRRELG
jgi:MerR family transcriptional regulator/heat shock protein HspR